MIEELIKETMMSAEEDFYSKPFLFSYSSLSKLLWNPAAFYQIYVLGLREESTSPSLVNGKVIHALLLSSDLFNEMFIISPSNLPSGNSKLIVDKIYNQHLNLQKLGDTRTELSDYQDEIINVLLEINLHQTLKTDQQRLDKVLTSENINYWNFLKLKEGKELIDEQTYKYCEESASIIRNNPELNKLMGLNVSEFDNIDVLNEVLLSKTLDKYPFGLKGIVDNIVINHDEKKIYINDLKTTSKDLKDFSESVEYYSYWMQAAIYLILVFFKYENLIANENYEVIFNFVVIDRNLMTYSFKVSSETSEKWFVRFTEEVLNVAKYHYTNKKFELPYKFCTKQVIL